MIVVVRQILLYNFHGHGRFACNNSKLWSLVSIYIAIDNGRVTSYCTSFSFSNKDYLGTINRITIAKRIVRNLSITILNGKKYFTIFWYLYLDITNHKSNILCPRLSKIPLISLGQTRMHLKLLFHIINFRTFLILFLFWQNGWNTDGIMHGLQLQPVLCISIGHFIWYDMIYIYI